MPKIERKERIVTDEYVAWDIFVDGERLPNKLLVYENGSYHGQRLSNNMWLSHACVWLYDDWRSCVQDMLNGKAWDEDAYSTEDTLPGFRKDGMDVTYKVERYKTKRYRGWTYQVFINDRLVWDMDAILPTEEDAKSMAIWTIENEWDGLVENYEDFLPV